MTDAQIELIKTFYLTHFTAPIFRVENEESLKKYIDIAGAIIEENLGIVIGVTSISFQLRLTEKVNIIEVDKIPLVTISDPKLEGDDLLEEDYPYKLFQTHVLFYDKISEGLFTMTYSAGVELTDKIKKAVCLEVNHLVETKMVDSERMGVITVRPDRSIIPVEVKALMGFTFKVDMV